jgi:hypothetical protein
VLILEDVPWAGAPTIRLLLHLASRSGGSPQTLVVIYRDTEIDERHPLAAGLADLYRALPAHPIALGGLDTAAVASLLERAPAGADRLGSGGAVRRRHRGDPPALARRSAGAGGRRRARGRSRAARSDRR